jgi:hypothetical protein
LDIIDDYDISSADGEQKQMSPAFKNNDNFVKAAAKMPGPGNETKWPRRDNAFMAKQSLSYQELNSRVWQLKQEGKYDTIYEWGAYVILGIFIGASGFLMDLIEESLVHFKDHFT